MLVYDANQSAVQNDAFALRGCLFSWCWLRRADWGAGRSPLCAGV